MSTTRTTLAILAALLGLGVLGSTAQAATDGKTLFTTLKCNMCHTVDSAAIAVIPDPDAEGDDEAGKPKDLSNVGATRDEKWIKDWMQKKVEIDGKTHRKKFSGEAADLDVLAKWLASLKTAAK